MQAKAAIVSPPLQRVEVGEAVGKIVLHTVEHKRSRISLKVLVLWFAMVIWLSLK